MNIQLKDMKLKFIVDRTNETLQRIVTDMNDLVIWDSGMQISTKVDVSDEGLDAWEAQMRSMPFWNIVLVERTIQ